MHQGRRASAAVFASQSGVLGAIARREAAANSLGTKMQCHEEWRTKKKIIADSKETKEKGLPSGSPPQTVRDLTSGGRGNDPGHASRHSIRHSNHRPTTAQPPPPPPITTFGPP
jgi:hypothetical protein